MDQAIRQREANIVFAGAVPLAKGTAILLEYPRTGVRLGVLTEENKTWLNPSRILATSPNIMYIARESGAVGAFHWTGSSQGFVEAVVRRCEIDFELSQTVMEVDILAERVAELETRLDFAERLLPRPEEARHDTPVGSG